MRRLTFSRTIGLPPRKLPPRVPPHERLKRTRRHWTVCGDVASLDFGRGRILRIDADDLPIAQALRWTAMQNVTTCYARARVFDERRGKWRFVYAQHIFAGYPLWRLEVDHENRDGLDNRRGNLRVVTHSENMRNSTQAIAARLRASNFPAAAVAMGAIETRDANRGQS